MPIIYCVIAIDGSLSCTKDSRCIVSSVSQFNLHCSFTPMASQEGEKRHGPTTNQQNDDASPHSEHSTHIRNSSEVKKNSKYGGRGSWRSRTYGGPRGHRDNEAGRIGQMASQGEKEVERVERNGHRGDRGNGTGKGGQGAPKRKKDLGRAEWAYVNPQASSIALVLIDEAVSQLTEERAIMSNLQKG